MPRALEYIEKKYGCKVRVRTNPVTGTVGTSPTLILRNDPDRLAWTLINTSANDIYVAWDSEVSSAHGVHLTPNGGSMGLDIDHDYTLVTMEVYAIASAAASGIYLIEVIGR